MVLTEDLRATRRREALKKTKDGMTEAQRIHQTLVAGRPPMTELRSPIEAARAAAVLLFQLRTKMTAKGLNPEDGKVRIVFVDTNFTQVFHNRFVIGKEAELIRELQSQPVIMLGLVFAIVDRETDPTGNEVIVGIKPFIVTPQVVGWMQDIMHSS